MDWQNQKRGLSGGTLTHAKITGRKKKKEQRGKKGAEITNESCTGPRKRTAVMGQNQRSKELEGGGGQLRPDPKEALMCVEKDTPSGKTGGQIIGDLAGRRKHDETKGFQNQTKRPNRAFYSKKKPVGAKRKGGRDLVTAGNGGDRTADKTKASKLRKKYRQAADTRRSPEVF